MSRLILDAGALLAYEREDRMVRALLRRAEVAGTRFRTTTGVVAQVWRDGARQARLVRFLRGVHEVELGRDEARRVGVLLGRWRGADVVDGSIVDAAANGDEILTSDPSDIGALAAAAGKTVVITRV